MQNLFVNSGVSYYPERSNSSNLFFSSLRRSCLLLVLIICISNSIKAQSLAINTDGSTAATSALLDVKSINKGVLIPRMSKVQRQGIIAPAIGLLVYQNAPDSTGFYFYDGAVWQQMATGGSLAQNWNLLGNAGTSASNFLGTTDAADLRFKANNQQVGYFGNASKNIFLGENAGSLTTPGTRNIFLGSGTGSQNNNRDNLIAIGDSALVNNGVGSFISYEGSNNVAIGSRALYANTIGYYNTALGSSTLQVNVTGGFNTAVGYSALYSNVGGNNNTGLGVYALSANASGNNNTALGTFSLLQNTIGNNNTAIGYNAMLFNNIGYSNVAIGNRALYNGYDGHNLVAIGDSALFNNGSLGVTGTEDVAVGSKALFSNTQGLDNTATGFNASYSNTSGSWNTATGARALYSTNTGYSNTATGYTAMQANTSGHDNAAYGTASLLSNTSGSWNTAIGTWALHNNLTGDQNIAIGYSSLYSNSGGANNLAIGPSAMLNNTNGTYNIALGYSALHENVTSNNNVAIGPFSLYSTNGSTSFSNVGIGFNALFSNVTGQNNTAIGDQADVLSNNLNYATAIGKSAKVSTSNTLVLGGTSLSAVNVAIGATTASSYGLPVPNRLLEIRNDGNPASPNLSSNLVLSTHGNTGSMGGVLWATPLVGPEFRTGYIEDIYEGGSAVRMAFSTRNSAGTFAERMTLNGAGNLGIGTTTANAPLQFSNSAVNRKIVLYDGNNNDNQYYGFGINGGVLRYQVDALFADHVFYAASSSTTSTELMRIRGSGAVGIGTATATKTLEVVGAGGTPVTAVIANRSGFGSAALELVSDYGLASQWRPGYIKSNDLGGFTGSLEFYTNGTGGGNLYGNVKGLEVRNGTTLTATGTVGSFSDMRLKKDIEPFTDGLNVITQINPVSFQYTDDAPFPSKEKQVGIIAQDLEKQAPYMVHQTADKQIKDLRWVDNQAYVFLLINAVKEQQAQIDALKKDVKRLEEGKKR